MLRMFGVIAGLVPAISLGWALRMAGHQRVPARLSTRYARP
jgi:hypothetical protein